MDSSRDFKRGLKLLWAKLAQGQTPSLEACNALALQNPYRHSDPLSEALTHLVLKNSGLIAPPLIPRIVPMPVPELCDLAVLWASLGEIEAASTLAKSIPLDFPWMWCRENEYLEKEALESLSRFSQVFPDLAVEHPNALDWTLIEAGILKGCLSFSGEGTSIGALRSDAAEIHAFGPQSFPLSDPSGFGIRKVREHKSRWASFAAAPEVWFEFKPKIVGSSLLFELTFFGLKPNVPLAFSFFVKASSAGVGSEKLKPKTLQRYQGITKPLRFGESLCLESLIPGKMEVIPLAGGGIYWDCEYLAAFEIHPINAKMAFSLYLDL